MCKIVKFIIFTSSKLRWKHFGFDGETFLSCLSITQFDKIQFQLFGGLWNCSSDQISRFYPKFSFTFSTNTRSKVFFSERKCEKNNLIKKLQNNLVSRLSECELYESENILKILSVMMKKKKNCDLRWYISSN